MHGPYIYTHINLNVSYVTFVRLSTSVSMDLQCRVLFPPLDRFWASQCDRTLTGISVVAWKPPYLYKLPRLSQRMQAILRGSVCASPGLA